MRNDSSFQAKLRQFVEDYKGDPNDEKAVFDELLVPVAQEYGLSATYEEFRSYMDSLMSPGCGDVSTP